MSLSPWQLIIILVIAALIFGTTKLKNAGKDLGGAVKGFKDAVKDEDASHLQKEASAKNKVLNHEDATVESHIEDIHVDEIKVKDPHL